MDVEGEERAGLAVDVEGQGLRGRAGDLDVDVEGEGRSGEPSC